MCVFFSLTHNTKKKTIGTFSGSVLLLNNMMGVGLPLLPMLLQQAGVVTPVFCIVFVALLSGYSATMLTEAMKYLPGNKNFDDRVEFASLAKFYLGRWPYILTQVFLNFALLSLNLVSILETVQVMDWTLVGIFTCTYGLTLWPEVGFQSVCLPRGTPPTGCDSPFGSSMVVGLGYAVVIVLIIPLGYWNLDDNIIIQVVSVFIQLAIIFNWCVTFFLQYFSPTYVYEPVSAFGSLKGQGAVLGQVLLNYAFIMSVPSWCNEKRRSSNVNRTVWSAVTVATTCYLLVSILGALAFPNLRGADILTAINGSGNRTIIDQISVYLYPLIAISTSIPVFSIIMRYNIVENGIMSARWANVICVLLPWLLVIPMTAGNNVFNTVSDFASIGFLLPINLILPFIIYVMAMRRKAYLKPCLCEPGPCSHDEPSSADDDLSSSSLGLIPHHHETSINNSGVGGGGRRGDDDDYDDDGNVKVASSSASSSIRHRGALRESSILRADHKHIIGADGQHRVVPRTDALPPTKWSAENPRCARCCCQWWVRMKDRPPISPLAPFSTRHPWLSARLPSSWVTFLDREETPAPDHVALPRRCPLVLKQYLAFTLALVSIVIFVGAFSLAIWGLVDPIRFNNSTNATSC